MDANALQMSNLDYFYLAAELREKLVGARFNQAYDVPHGFRLRFQKNGALNLWVELGTRLHLTQSIPVAPDTQSSFVKFIRKELANARVEQVSQIGFDRIIRIEFAGRAVSALVFEQFGKGNVVAVDERHTILRPLFGRDFAQRQLHKGLAYTAPESTRMHILKVTGESLSHQTKQGQSVMRTLRDSVEITALYAQEACTRAGIEGDSKAEALSNDEWNAIARSVRGLLEEPTGRACVYYAGGNPHAFSAFPLQSMRSRNMIETTFPTLSEALDAVYTPKLVETLQKEATHAKQSEVSKLEHVLKEQEEARKTIEAHANEQQAVGEWLHAHLQEIKALLAKATTLRKQGYSAEEMQNALAPFAQALKVSVTVSPDRLKLALTGRE